MSERQAFIQSVVAGVTHAAPKVVQYHNGYLVAFRNGDGDRVATVLEHTLSNDQITQRIKALFAVKPENLASQDALDKLKG